MSSANLLFVGIPFEGEDDFIRGSSLGPAKIRWVMESIEDFSYYQERSLPSFEDLGDIYLPDIPQEEVPLYIEEKLRGKLRPPFLAVGGNHLITLPLVRIVKEHHPNLKVVHFDAHLDRRDRYKGFFHSYSTVMRRVEEVVGSERVYTFGYRSKAESEDEGKSFPEGVLEPLKSSIEELMDSPLYLTIDLDVLNPSEFPAVSNPEPGGISFYELIESLKLLKDNIVAADIVEFNPVASCDIYPAVTAAILVRELLIILVGK
jgi:agmatinase